MNETLKELFFAFLYALNVFAFYKIGKINGSIEAGREILEGIREINKEFKQKENTNQKPL